MLKKIVVIISLCILIKSSQQHVVKPTGTSALQLEQNQKSVHNMDHAAELLDVVPVKPLQQIIWGYLDCWNETHKFEHTAATRASTQIVFSADNRFIKCYTHPEFTLYNLKTKDSAKIRFDFSRKYTPDIPMPELQTCALSPNGKYLIFACTYNSAFVFDLSTGREIKTLQIHAKTAQEVWHPSIERIVFSPDSSLCALICKRRRDWADTKSEIEIWDAKTFEFKQKIEFYEQHNNIIFSSDNNYAAVARDYPSVCFRNLKTQTGAFFAQRAEDIVKHPHQIVSLAWSPDMNIFAVASDKEIICWNRVNDEFKFHGFIKQNTGESFLAPEVCITFITWSPDGRYLAIQTGPANRHSEKIESLHLWDREQNKIEVTIPDVLFFVFSPDGTQVATVSSDKTIKIWQNPVVALDIIAKNKAKSDQAAQIASKSSCVIS